MEYTEKMHAERMIKMIEELGSDEVCYSCPTCKDFSISSGPLLGLDDRDWTDCDICHAFVGMPPTKECEECPCDHFGPEEAIRITIQKLKEKGYM